MSGDPLGLYEYLVETLYCLEAEERGRSHWVMDAEWLNDLRRATQPGGQPLWVPSFSLSGPDLLLGLPIEIRKDAGAPHLEFA